MAHKGYCVRMSGESRSFPNPHPFVSEADRDGDVVVLIGTPSLRESVVPDKRAVALELGIESLAVHTGGRGAPETSNVVGFARWRLGDNPPSDLIELVSEPATRREAVAAAREVFEAAGFTVSLCADRTGRIVDRLMRPQFNLALRAVDDGLATPEDLELCLRLGLGYRNGLLAPLEASGLVHHHDVTRALFEAYGQAQFAPPRQTVAAKSREARIAMEQER